MTPYAKLVAQREGGRVRRCHAMPHVIGEQDNAQHTFNMLILAYGLHPCPSPELIKAITFHDLHERYAGDLPMTAKKLNPKLRAEYERVCKSIDLRIGTEVGMAVDDRRWLRALDGLEYLLWCGDQLIMGNNGARAGFDMQLDWLLNAPDGAVPVPVLEFAKRYRPEPGPHALP